jgi:hypothetical protein
MDIPSVCIPFIVAILGIAYPVLFQVISGLDEKYSSEVILELFNKEKERKYFWFFLIASLLAILLWIMKIPPIIDLKGLNFLIENSATYLLLLTTIVLIIFFFLFVNKILVYYTPGLIVKYLIKMHKKNEQNAELLYFKGLSDIFIRSIKNQNETILKTISDFLYWAFQAHREKYIDRPVEYPIAFYEIVYKSIIELALNKNKNLIF